MIIAIAPRLLTIVLALALLLSSGCAGTRANDDAALGPDWRVLPSSPLPDLRGLPTTSFWTGTEILVLGVGHETFVAAAYAPGSDSWRALAESPLGWRDGYSAVWTGREAIVWGGADDAGSHADGAALDVRAGVWRKLPPSGLSARNSHVAAWTGTEMIVVGGGHDALFSAEGAAYDPERRRWRAIAAMPSPRVEPSAVWTGQELILWGGFDGHRLLATGVAYDPAIDRWREIASAPIAGRVDHSAVWSGSELIVWGGTQRSEEEPPFADGAAYDPRTDSWRPLRRSPLEPRYEHAAVWTNDGMVIWGGTSTTIGAKGARALPDGALYRSETDTWQPLPASPLAARYRASASWTGEELILWGGCCEGNTGRGFTSGAAIATR